MVLNWFLCFGTSILVFHSVGNVIIPTDELIFFKMVKTTNQIWIWTIFCQQHVPFISFYSVAIECHRDIPENSGGVTNNREGF